MNLENKVRADIQEIESVSSNGTLHSCEELQQMLIMTYKNYIPTIDEGLEKLIHGTSYIATYRRNLNLLKRKLGIFVAMKNNNEFDMSKQQQITLINQNYNNNSNVNTVELDLQFLQVKKVISDDVSLSESEIEEILSKITELEDLVKSKDSKPTKLKKCKQLIGWVTNKGVKVIIEMLPLITEVLKQTQSLAD